MMLHLWRKLTIILAWPLILLIMIYQKTISPDRGLLKFFFSHGFCKFYPSCSEYGIQSLKKYGLFKGSWKMIGRILRCNPWSNGGVDLP